MAAIVGTSGSVVFTAMSASSPSADSIVEASVRRWTANITRSSHDVNTFTTSGARVRIGGIIRLTGSLDGWLDTTQTFLDTDWDAVVHSSGTYAATADGFVLNASSKGGTQRIQYKFAGWLSGLHANVRRGEPNSFSADFVSTGVITSTAVA